MMQISDRAKQLNESATLAVSARAAELKRGGTDVVGFGAGEPDFDTPQHIIEATKRALDAGHTRYAKPSSGIPEAKAAVCEKFRRDNRLDYKPDQVIVTVGAKEALFLAFSAILNPGDEVLLPCPYWVSFPEQVRLCGGEVVSIMGDEANGLRVRPEQIAQAVTPKTKVVVFNSPSNPGGFAYSPDETRAIAAALTGKDVIVFADEMYDCLRFGERRENLSFATISPEWAEKTITFNAASKSHAMTGWRVGYAAGPKPLISAMAKIQSHTTSGTATFIHHALVEALTGSQAHVEKMRTEFERRGMHMHARLMAMRGVTCVKPDGAFYCFPNVSGTFSALDVQNSGDFCKKILEVVHVAMVPGDAFGMDTHVRLSFATDMKTIDKGLDRLEKVLGRK